MGGIIRKTKADSLRQHAEEIVRGEEDSEQEPLSPELLKLLLHELRVKQVALEMQNKELRRTQHELEVSRARYFDLYDLAPVGYLTLNEKGLILNANLTAVNMLGAERTTLIKQQLSRFILPDDQDIFYLHCKQLVKTSKPKTCEFRMIQTNGVQFWARMDTSPGQSKETGHLVLRVVLSDISNRKSSEEALRVSEARYLSIIEDQNELICRFLPDGRLSFVNGAYARYYGRSQTELINKNFSPNIPESDLSMILKCQAGINPDNPVAAFTHRIINADGEVRWQRWTQRGIYVDGVLLEYQAVGFDITERKRAEMTLQARLRINEYMFHHSQDELLTKILDEAEDLTDSQIGFYHFLNDDQMTLTLQSWSSRTLSTICTAEGKGHQYPVESAGVWCDCIREKKPVIHNNYELLPHRKGVPAGHPTVLRELVVPIYRNSLIVGVLGVGNKCTDYTNQDIETLQQFANLARDMIERKRAEEKLRSVSIYTRTLLEASLYPMVTISAEGKITDVNEASVRITGLPREQLIATDFSSYFTDTEKAREVYLRVYSDGFVHDYPLAIRHVSGRVTYVLYNASIYRDEQGEVKGVFAAARDVTEQKRAEAALKQAHDELEVRVAERTAALEQANEQMKKVSFQLVWAEERERERIAGELHDQVGQSLLLAKMKLDALTHEISSDSVHTFAGEASSLLETSIHDIRSLTFRMRPPILDTSGIETALEWLCSSISNDYALKIDFTNDCEPMILSAEMRYSLYQAVRELLLNVVKHAKSDKAQLSVKVDSHNLHVHVVDNGVGFKHPDAHLKHVINGGYGLYNVQQRIEQMGGRFAIKSAPGIGTSVTLMVPFADN